MFPKDFIFRQQENLVDNQKCQAGFRPLCNKILVCVYSLKTTIFPFLSQLHLNQMSVTYFLVTSDEKQSCFHHSSIFVPNNSMYYKWF